MRSLILLFLVIATVSANAQQTATQNSPFSLRKAWISTIDTPIDRMTEILQYRIRHVRHGAPTQQEDNTCNGTNAPTGSHTSHQTFVFLGDTYTDLCMEDAVMITRSGTTGSFQFMDTWFEELPAGEEYIPERNNPATTFRFMDDYFTDFPAEQLLIPDVM